MLEALKVAHSGWEFDQILCLARGGMRPGDVLSRVFDKPLAIMSTSSYRAEAGTIQGRLDMAKFVTMPKGDLVGRVLLEREPVRIPDVLADKEFTLFEAQRAGGFRSILGVPMLRKGKLIGVIAVWTTGEARPFTEKHVELVATFADQAVIAVENTRMFSELEERNRDLTESLEQQTATSEMLQVISESQRDVQPVFEAIAANALKLCNY